MKFQIKHEIKGRIRIHVIQKRMTFAQADTLQYYLTGYDFIQNVKIQERTCDATIRFQGDREDVIHALRRFSYERIEVPEDFIKNSGREMNRFYWDKLMDQVILHYGTKIFLPMSVRAGIATVKSVKYIWEGLCTLARGRIEVPVLDGTAVGVSVFRGDYATASSVMFLLGEMGLALNVSGKKILSPNSGQSIK